MGICTRAKAKVSRANIDKCAHVYSRFLNVYLFTWETLANETLQKRTKEEYKNFKLHKITCRLLSTSLKYFIRTYHLHNIVPYTKFQ